MPQTTLTPAVQQLLRERDRTAALAAEAAAHGWPDADQLEQHQHDLEEHLENVLPTTIWRRLFPSWTLDTVLRSHDPDHPAPQHCATCARTTTRPHQRQTA